MDQEEIKKSLRHSFTSAQPDEEVKISKNQFGHTVLGDVKPHDTSMHTFEQDESGSLKASFDIRDLADHPELQKFHKVFNSETAEEEEIVEKKEFIPQNVILAKLLNELDEMDGTSKKFKAHPNSDGTVQIDPNTKIEIRYDQMKDCANKECLCALPKDAKFCLKCGTPQMPKFCTECGFNFPGMEKFCPDCGTKR